MRNSVKILLFLVVLASGAGAFLVFSDEFGGPSSTVSFGDKTIKVYGGSSQAISSIDGGRKVVVDNHTVEVVGDKVTVNGKEQSFPGYKVLKIKVSGSGEISVSSE